MKKWLAVCTTALLGAGALVLGLALPAQAHTKAVNATCETLSVNLQHYQRGSSGTADSTAYQRYSWNGGNTETAPTEVPPSANWNPDNKKKPGDDPIGQPFQAGNGENASWFYWTATTVPGIPATVNTVSVLIDDVVVLAPTEFGTSFTQSWNFTPSNVTHTYKVIVRAWDDPVDTNGWSFNQRGTSGECGPVVVPPAKDASAAIVLTDETCAAPGSVALGTIVNATWGELSIVNGHYSVTATAAANHVFAGGEATITLSGDLPSATGFQNTNSEAPCYVAPPEPKVTFGEVEDGTWKCDDTTVKTTQTKTTVTYEFDSTTGEYTENEPVVETVNSVRDLTKSEQTKCPGLAYTGADGNLIAGGLGGGIALLLGGASLILWRRHRELEKSRELSDRLNSI